ncbi:hypothetical protein [Halobellus limi]|jgi:hypothetical protein|uniref:Uncharacterized protein n=1 Tax=Halobellus limi TaxID=699433 RepID=A0A1H6BJK2_9EURY|nr:hypothetical protein [Halobellus limi]SEG60366.1 hypothetical protein SAMN04488133_2860 [Halobellus limi]
MRARTWLIAARYGAPEEYGIPRLPAWRVCRPDCGGLALADDDAEPFIAAERPMKVRR